MMHTIRQAQLLPQLPGPAQSSGSQSWLHAGNTGDLQNPDTWLPFPELLMYQPQVGPEHGNVLNHPKGSNVQKGKVLT